MDTSIFEIGWIHYLKKGCQVDKILKQNVKQYIGKSGKANSLDPDKPSHLDLHSL